VGVCICRYKREYVYRYRQMVDDVNESVDTCKCAMQGMGE
jgi:hypothetical protein